MIPSASAAASLEMRGALPPEVDSAGKDGVGDDVILPMKNPATSAALIKRRESGTVICLLGGGENRVAIDELGLKLGLATKVLVVRDRSSRVNYFFMHKDSGTLEMDAKRNAICAGNPSIADVLVHVEPDDELDD